MSRMSKNSTVALWITISFMLAAQGYSAETPAAPESTAKEPAGVAKAETAKPLAPPVAVDIETGRALYRGNCAACHGEHGDGDGVAAKAVSIRPRAFSHEGFRYVSTEGAPSDEDFIRTIHFGRRNGQMPAFPYLMDEQIRSLALFLREMNRQSAVAKLKAKKPDLDEKTVERVTQRQVAPGKPIVWHAPSADFKTDTAKGRALFSANCAQCHGAEGHGDSQTPLLDSEGRPIKARDLTTGEFRGGAEPLDLFFRIRCGLPGTPMPAGSALSDDDAWQLVNYVKHLAHK